MFYDIAILLSWMPPTLYALCISVIVLFTAYVILKVLKLLWDILPIA